MTPTYTFSVRLAASEAATSGPIVLGTTADRAARPVTLDPQVSPARIYQIERWRRREHDFQYFI